jgi:hypothetical protein
MKKPTSSLLNKEQANKINQTFDLANLSFESKSGKSTVKSVPVIEFSVQEPYLKLTLELPLSVSLLFSIKHKYLQTQLDLSNLSNMYLLGFDQSLTFIGVSIINEKSKAPFQILNQGKYFLLLNRQEGIDFSRLSKLSILPSKIQFNVLEELTNEQLVERYNKECGNTGWTSSRATFLVELQAELKSRNLNLSAISDEGKGLNLNANNKCKLVGNKLVRILL